MNDYEPVCTRCGDRNDIGHEPGAFTDALGYGPSCPDCEGAHVSRRKRLADDFGNLRATKPNRRTQGEDGNE